MAGTAGGVKKGHPEALQWGCGIALSGRDTGGHVGTAGPRGPAWGMPLQHSPSLWRVSLHPGAWVTGRTRRPACCQDAQGDSPGYPRSRLMPMCRLLKPAPPSSGTISLPYTHGLHPTVSAQVRATASRNPYPTHCHCPEGLSIFSVFHKAGFLWFVLKIPFISGAPVTGT